MAGKKSDWSWEKLQNSNFLKNVMYLNNSTAVSKKLWTPGNEGSSIFQVIGIFKKWYSYGLYISIKATNFLILKGVAQKLRLPCPLEVWNSFGGKSILSVAKGTKFGGKLKTHEYYNWWKFGVNISNHFWVIQN